jgi:hypothetical protein
MTLINRRRARRLAQILTFTIVVAGLALFAGLPWVLGRPFAHRWLESQASAILAPSSVEFAEIRLSWFDPTEITGVMLRNDQAGRVLVAPRAVYQLSLWQILFNRPGSATLALPGGELDIERRLDGTIDLYETLRPLIDEHPKRQLIIKVEHGRLRFRDSALSEPIVADTADVVLDLSVDPQPIEWRVDLSKVRADGHSSRLRFTGQYGRSDLGAMPRGDASISFEATQWPWAVATSGIEARGDLDVTMSARRNTGQWLLSGNASVGNLVGKSERLPDRTIRLDSVLAAWNVEGGDDLWTARQLELSAPLKSRASDDSVSSTAERGDPLGGNLGLALQARYAPPSERIEIAALSLNAPFAQLDASGSIDSLRTAPRVDLKGYLKPDWPALNEKLIREVEPNAHIAGRARPWRVSGTIANGPGVDPLARLEGEVGVQLDELDVFGMRLGATALVVRIAGGQLRFDPIDAVLNEGALHLEPQFSKDGAGRLRLKLGQSSTLKGAIVNDEVSHRVLSYAAPILDGATRVQGRVSIKELDAEFPLLDAAGSPARVEGNVDFDDVRFLPGPLADELLSLLPNDRRPMLVLRDPVSFRISERKVYQEGLIIPLGAVGAVGVEGSVDFDRNLDLIARFSLNPPGPGAPVVSSILQAAKFELPIRGTLRQPKIDGQAMKQRLKSLGLDLLDTTLAAGADRILRLLDNLPIRREARKPPPEAGQPNSRTPEQRSVRREARKPPPEAGQPDSRTPEQRSIRREAVKPPADAEAGQAESRTPEQRSMSREERRRERVQKKAERRLKRGRPSG